VIELYASNVKELIQQSTILAPRAAGGRASEVVNLPDYGEVGMKNPPVRPRIPGGLVVGDQVGPVRADEHGIRGAGEEEIEFLQDRGELREVRGYQ
jgi:hypothetical protein